MTKELSVFLKNGLIEISLTLNDYLFCLNKRCVPNLIITSKFGTHLYYSVHYFIIWYTTLLSSYSLLFYTIILTPPLHS